MKKKKEKQSRKSCQRVGVFTAWFYGHYQAELISGIEEAARHFNAQILYFSGRALDSPVPYENDHNIVYDTALNASLDGLIIISLLANYCDDNTLTKFVSKYKNIPIITINFRSLIGNAILTNNTPGFSELMDHLIEKHKYRKLAFVKGPERNQDAIERYNAYKTSLSKNGIDFNPALITDGYYTFRAGQAAVRVYLDERGFKPGQDIEAIVCANDAIALGVIDALYSRGLQVPRDIAVTGFDNMNESIFPKFPLTSVKQLLREIGHRAVSNLMDYQENQEPLFFDTELVIRDSCGCIKPEEQASPIPDQNREQKSGHPLNPYIYKKDLEFIYYEIIRIIDNLKDVQNMSELTTWMQSTIPNLEINSAWIFLFSQVTSDIRDYTLLTGYDLKELEKTELMNTIHENVIFEDILNRKSNRSYCIMPLLFKKNKYGLLIMEVNQVTSFVYDTLSSHIGSTIKNIFLGEEVTAMNRQLLKSNEQKTQFFINMAHETKTPLTLIQNYMALYLEQNEPDEKLLIIKQNIDLLLANMLNFLDVERFQKGNTIYQHDTLVDLSESAHKKCELFRIMAGKKNIRIIVNADNRMIIRIDPWALDRIFNNLLDNAVKYTQANGRIKLDIRSENGRIILRISDNGPGLPTYLWEHIFDPYYLLSKKRNRQQGMGVGLSIVKKIIDELGADIKVEKNKGGGTCFTITFKDERSSLNNETLQEIKANAPLSPPIQEKIKERNILPGKRLIFIVDDNIQLLKFLQTAFSKSYNVLVARNTAEALVKLKIIPRPDVIISDIMMDGEDGYQLFSVLSTKDGYNDIPFIFLTALGGEKAKLKGLDLGAVDYIEKPFSITALRSKIKSIIELRKRQDKQNLEHIRNKIDRALSGSNKITEDSSKSKLERLCEKYGIIGLERKIIRMLANGLLNKEIAICTNISQRAVEYHITKIYRKCGVNSKYDLLNKFQG